MDELTNAGRDFKSSSYVFIGIRHPEAEVAAALTAATTEAADTTKDYKATVAALRPLGCMELTKEIKQEAKL